MFSLQLQVGENLIKVYRQSESQLIKPVILVMVGLYLPIWFLYQYNLLPKLSWLLAFWTLIVLIYAVNKYLLWLLTTYIVTDRRVISIKYKSLTKRETEEIMVKDVSNVREKSTGIFSHLFKFATLELEGAGTPIKFVNIRETAEVKQLISKLKQ